MVRSRASGDHYTALDQFPFVVGIDGVGCLDDGSRVYFALPRPPYGSLAERTVVPIAWCMPVPPQLDDATAAAIVLPGVSSWAALTERARLQRGETVLVNGATGTAGGLAVQVAKHLGAQKVIATGRNPRALQRLPELGADVVLSLTQPAESLDSALQEEFAQGVDVVVDYLWGASAETVLIAGARAGREGVPVRFVSIGSASGSHVSLPSAVLRSSSLVLLGSGLRSVPADRWINATSEFLKAIVPGQFRVHRRTVPWTELSRVWSETDTSVRTVLAVGG